MISFTRDHQTFHYRAAAVFIHQQKVLLHRLITDNFWALPGGRVELMERSPDTIVREMQEELGAEAQVGRLLWVVENFFEHQSKPHHEIGFYYLTTFPPDCVLYQQNTPFMGKEGELDLIFQWFPIKELTTIRLYPTLLYDALPNLSTTITHYIHSGVKTLG